MNEEFILMNASQTQYKICDTNGMHLSDEDICKRSCDRVCHQTYYTLDVEKSKSLGQTNSSIRLEFLKSQEFHYISQQKYHFVDFLSNIGGLITLWFGCALIDTNVLIRRIIMRIKIIILFLINNT